MKPNRSPAAFRHALPAVALLAAGCGAAPPPVIAASAAPSTPAPVPPPVDVWPAVLAGGGPWTLIGGDGRTLLVEAYAPRRLGTGEVVRLRFTLAGTPYTVPPTQVASDGAVIHLLDETLEDADVVDALEATSPWPRRAVPLPQQTRADGLYATVWRGPAPPGETVVCYGEGPPPDAPDCEDICFSELCIAERGGVVQLSGRWAPEGDVYSAAGYADFMQRYSMVRTPAGQP